MLPQPIFSISCRLTAIGLSFSLLPSRVRGFLFRARRCFRLLRRYGRYLHLNESRLKVGLYLFRKHGGKVVFFGRFVAVLRAWAAFLAGTNRMPWPRFLLFNALGGISWATIYGLGGYLLGDNINRLTGPVGIIF